MKWCFSEQNVFCDDILYIDLRKISNFNSRISLFKDLQKLCFFATHMIEFLKDLPLLKNLRVLMIYDCFVDPRYTSEPVPRIALESISIEKFLILYEEGVEEPEGQTIDFDTPNLSSLILWDVGSHSSIDRDPNVIITPIHSSFRFPLKIRHLECVEFNSEMCVLKNLETLICQKITCPFPLNDYKSLHRLELFPREERELDYIRAIINEKKNLRRENLEITVCGFKNLLFAPEVEPLFGPSLCFDLSKNYLDQIAEHPDKLVARIPWHFRVDFVVLFNIFKGVPKDLFEKLHNIHSVFISQNEQTGRRPFKASDVLQLLVRCKPKWVTIRNFNFERNFYEELTSIQSIVTLQIKEEFENLDYDHFLKLKYLEHFFLFPHKNSPLISYQSFLN